jgi:hypothetical protein
MWIGWIIFWEGKAACWMSGTERRKRAGQRWEVQDEGEEVVDDGLESKPNPMGAREREGRRKERGSDGWQKKARKG